MIILNLSTSLQGSQDLIHIKRIEIIVIAHKDRLCRFAFDLIEQLLNKRGCGKSGLTFHKTLTLHAN